MSSTPDGPHPVFRAGGISYLRIPAPDPSGTAAFYGTVFGWSIDLDRPDPSFADGSGHVIGHFRKDLPVSGDGGVVPYVYVDLVAETVTKIVENGGEVVTAPYPEGDLWVALFLDPAGNRMGLWQRGPLG